MEEMVEPFQVRLANADIADLRERLGRTRWPERETVADWGQGIPLAYAQELCGYWADGYDFGFVDRINAHPQLRTEIDGLGIHLLHITSPEPDALPLLLTHGWPGSVVEFLDVIGPLTDPRSHGGDAADAFHLVVPSLPGSTAAGTSPPSSNPGRSSSRCAASSASCADHGYQKASRRAAAVSLAH
jgi:hypothetical protein